MNDESYDTIKGGDRIEGDRIEDGDRIEGDRIKGDRIEGDRIEGDRIKGDRIESGNRIEDGNRNEDIQLYCSVFKNIWLNYSAFRDSRLGCSGTRAGNESKGKSKSSCKAETKGSSDDLHQAGIG